MAKKEKPAPQTVAPRFSKQQFLAGKTLPYPKDMAAAVLSENKTYTKEEAGKLVNNYLERKV